MQLVFNGDNTFAEVAEKYTIGGAAYGVALANLVGATDPNAKPNAGFVINIPDSWIKQAWLSAIYSPANNVPATIDVTGGGANTTTSPTIFTTSNKTGLPWWAWVAVGLAGVFVLMDAGSKRTPKRRVRRAK